MRLVNRETFLRMPGQVVFYFVDPTSDLSGPCVRLTPGEPTFPVSFRYIDLNRLTATEFESSDEQFNYLQRAQGAAPFFEGEELTPDIETISIDKNFNEEQLFMVLNVEDVYRLMSVLEMAVSR